MTRHHTSQTLYTRNVLSIFISVVCVIAGCIWNSYELEHIVSHPAGGKNFGYGLTLCQCLFIAVVGGLHFLTLRLGSRLFFFVAAKKGTAASTTGEKIIPPPPPPLFLLDATYASMTALLFWITNVINNVVFGFGIAVPIQQVIRSSSLLTSALSNWWFNGKRFSLIQVFLLFCITFGIASLSISSVTVANDRNNNNKRDKDNDAASLLGAAAAAAEACSSERGGVSSFDCGQAQKLASSSATNNFPSASSLFPDPTDKQATLRWLSGVGMLCLSALLGTVLGIVQDVMFKRAKARVNHAANNNHVFDAIPGVTEEALFVSHAISVVLFAVQSGFHLLPVYQTVMHDMPRDLQMHLLWNVVSQYVCVWGVFTLARVSSSFFLTMATTVRKFFSLCLSFAYFGHAQNMSWDQLHAVAMVTVAVSVYPFVPSPQNNNAQQQQQQQQHQQEREGEQDHNADEGKKKR